MCPDFTARETKRAPSTTNCPSCARPRGVIARLTSSLTPLHPRAVIVVLRPQTDGRASPPILPGGHLSEPREREQPVLSQRAHGFMQASISSTLLGIAAVRFS